MHVLRWLWHVIGRVADGELTVAGGGIALFGLLATIPAVAAVVSIYALAADPSDIPTHLGPLRHLVPAAVHGFIVEQLGRASADTGELSFTLVTSLVLSIDRRDQARRPQHHQPRGRDAVGRWHRTLDGSRRRRLIRLFLSGTR